VEIELIDFRMYRIYFDENERDASGRYYLGIPGSLKDIAPIADHLKDGLRVVIYMAHELEMEAVLEWDRRNNCWMARSIEGTLQYLE